VLFFFSFFTMNLFVGVSVPFEIKQKITELQKSISTLECIKLVKPENFHFTLKFLGEVDEHSAADVLEKISKRYEKFTANIFGVGVFNDGDNVKVVWVGTDDNAKFKSLADDVRDSLKNIRKDEYSIKLHLTIARVKAGTNIDKIWDFVRSNDNRIFGSFLIDRIVLFKSNLRRGEINYSILREFFFSDSTSM
jgi:RNA 2',3'-cyclic 3'-phosphodiesterase